MKIYIDFSKQAITKIDSDVAYVGDVYSNVFELLFFNYGDATDWFPTMSQLAPNGREAGDFSADALEEDETYEHVENGITYMRYTFTIGEGWVRMKGRSNFFIWVNKLVDSNTSLQRKCYGKLNVALNESTDNYFIQDAYFNPKVKEYIDNTIGDDLETYKSTIDDEVEAQNETIASLMQASPSVFDTASNITALTENKGVAVATDTGYIYYWDSTLSTPAYVSSGLQYNSLSSYVKHSGNQLQDGNGNDFYPNIAPKEKGLINELRQELKTDYYFDGIYKKFIMPDSAFDAFDIDIFSDGRNYIHNYNIEKYKNTGGTTYYFSPSGNNNNDGLSELTPKQSPSVITSYYNNGDTIILMDGLYKRDAMPVVAKNINIIAKNIGKAYVVNSDNNYIYTKTSGYTNVYETTRSNVVGVIIKNEEKYIQLSLVNSIELVDATPLSFTVQSGITYINVANIVTPNNNTVFLNLATGLPLLKLNTSLTQDITLYVEGVNFIGGQNGGVNLVNTATYTFNFYAKDCNFIGANTSGDKFDALSIRGGNSYLVNCKACYSNKDGFNYHSSNGIIPKALEINCEGYGNGNFYNSNNTYNGSTAHDGVTIIRINGVYHDNKGGNVADVHENTKSLNIRCVAFNSISSDTGSNADFIAQQAGTTMWLYNCKALNSDWSIYAVSGTTIYKKNCDYKNTQGSGSIIDL